jgi:hypothetical protein
MAGVAASAASDHMANIIIKIIKFLYKIIKFLYLLLAPHSDVT